MTIEQKYPKVLFLVHAASITAAISWGWDTQGWDLPRASVTGAGLLVVNIIAIAYYMTGSEVIEFNDRQIVRSRTNLGWQRTSEFELEKCSRLKWLEYFGKPGFFRCQYGWRTFSFGKYLTQKQADSVLAALESSLPNVANHLLRGASLRGVAIRP